MFRLPGDAARRNANAAAPPDVRPGGGGVEAARREAGRDVPRGQLMNLLARSLLAGGRSSSSKSKSAADLLLPGTFVVCQGSPGDGMANTIDGLPDLPREEGTTSSPSAAAAARGEERRRDEGAAAAEPRRVSPVRGRCQVASPASGPEGTGRHRTRPRSSSASACPTREANPPGRPRGESLGGPAGPNPATATTEGGLHLPLGSMSPLMQTALATGLHGVGAHERGDIFSPSPLRRETLAGGGRKEGLADGLTPPMLESAASATEVAGSPKRKGEEGRRTLKRRNLSVGASDGPAAGGTGGAADRGSISDAAASEPPPSPVDAGAASDRRSPPRRTPAEARSVEKWDEERRRSELGRLREERDNVRVLIARRRQESRRDRGPRGQSSASPGPSGRDGAPSAAGTSVSGSSSDSSSQTDSPAGSDCGSCVVVEDRVKDPLTLLEEGIERAHAHRGWYQRDGRLVVLSSLPRLDDGGGLGFGGDGTVDWEGREVVASPVVVDGEVLTLSPGKEVQAADAVILDTFTLRRVHPGGKSSPRPRLVLDPVSDDADPSRHLVFLRLASPRPGYVLASVHGYPLLLPGPASSHVDRPDWLWRVTCSPDGAYVRDGLELSSSRTCVLPYGTVVGVDGKAVNDMGLSRLSVEAYVDRGDGDEGDAESSENDDDDGGEKDEDGTSPYTRRVGYISEFLNPLSGQRGNVVEAVPFPVPAVYRVVHAGGAVIRSGVELSSSQIGMASRDAVLSVVGWAYSDGPRHRCLERLKLAGGGGWISRTLNRRPPHDVPVVELLGVDGRFDPDDPSSFHFECMRGVLDELRAGEEADAGCCPAAADGGPGSDSPLAAAAADRMRRISSYADISEIGDDPADSCRDDPGCDAVVTPPGGAPRHRPALFRSGSLLPSPAPGPMDAIRESSSSCGRGGDVAGASALPSEGYWSSSTNNPNRCLICLSEERTATIVHGETGHIACCLTCARILKARGDACPVCRLPIDLVVQQFWA